MSAMALAVWPLAGLAIALFSFLVYPAINSRKWGAPLDTSREAVIEGALGMIFGVMLFGPYMLPAVVVMTLVHEYGHVLAFRLIGHRRPLMRLAIFGGVAFSGERYKNQAEGAFVALMGPGFSVPLLVVLIAAASALSDIAPPVAGYLASSAFIVAAINGLNLLPFYPLDGGHALRAAATSLGHQFAHNVALAMIFVLAVFSLFMQMWFFLIIAAIGLGGAMQAAKLDFGIRPMRPLTALLTLTTHASLLAVHFYIAWPWLYGMYLQALLKLGALSIN